jgi:hypothetical protein
MKALACGCTPCPICKAKGYFFVSMDGTASPYQCEDTDEEETCDWCEGSGRDKMCDQHAAAWQEEDDFSAPACG